MSSSDAQKLPSEEGNPVPAESPTSSNPRSQNLRRRLARLTPLQLGIFVMIVATLLMGARWAVAGDGDITTFILAGAGFTDASQTPGQIAVFEGAGNDGQFNYRYALDPTTITTDSHLGVQLDLALRANRIGYPVLVWLASLGGRAAAVPWALVGVNLVAIGFVGWASAILARRWGRIPAAGLIVPAWCGFVFTISRDYADVAGAALALGALVADSRRRPVVFGLLLTAACLTRELYIALVAGLVLERSMTWIQQRRVMPAIEDAAWAIPSVAFVTWQAFAASQVGEIPLLSGEGNRTWPFLGIADALRIWANDLLGAVDAPMQAAMGALSVVQFVALVVFCIAVVRAMRWPPAVPGVTSAWLGLAAVSVVLSSDVWAAYNDFRNLSELAVLGSVIVLCSSRPLLAPAGAVGVGWAATVIPRIVKL